MNLLILGRGKTGSLVAEVAHARRHHVRVLCSSDNENASALTADYLSDINAVIDFTTPSAVAANAEACIRAGKSMVVGTTGWHEQAPRLRENVQKKDAPSGTAITLQRILREAGGQELEITSFREGDVVGMHEVVFNSQNDRIYLCHDSKSRRGFAEGAVRAAEWLAGKQGFFEFREIWKQL